MPFRGPILTYGESEPYSAPVTIPADKNGAMGLPDALKQPCRGGRPEFLSPRIGNTISKANRSEQTAYRPS